MGVIAKSSREGVIEGVIIISMSANQIRTTNVGLEGKKGEGAIEGVIWHLFAQLKKTRKNNNNTAIFQLNKRNDRKGWMERGVIGE